MPRVNPNKSKGKSDKDNLSKRAGMTIGGIAGAGKAENEANSQKISIQVRNQFKRITDAIKEDPSKIGQLRELIAHSESANLLFQATIPELTISEIGAIFMNKLPLDERNKISESLGVSVRKETYADGSEVVYTTILIPHDEIESKTKVSHLNPRGYSSQDPNDISEIEVSDILQTIDNKQEASVIGYMGKDGLIHIVDGSRRRLACIKAGILLKVDLADRELDANLLSFILEQTDKANESKRMFNPVEKGIMYENLLESGLPIEEVMKRFGVKERYISDCIKISKISDKMLNLVYSRSRIGMPLLKSLKVIDDAISTKSPEEQKSIWDSIQEKRSELFALPEFGEDFILKIEDNEQVNLINKNNKRIVKEIETLLSTMGAIDQVSQRSTPSFQTVFTKSKGRVKQKVEYKTSPKGKGSVSTIKLTNFTEEQVKAALDFLEKQSESPVTA